MTIYGPLSESVGRGYTLLIGIAIVGMIICFNSQSIHSLQIGRFVQGCGLGAANCLWRFSSYLVNLIILSILLAPFLGALQQYIGWHANFVFLLC